MTAEKNTLQELVIEIVIRDVGCHHSFRGITTYSNRSKSCAIIWSNYETHSWWEALLWGI